MLLAVEVGAPGFEPGTFRPQSERATRLRHAPKRLYEAESNPEIELTCFAPTIWSAPSRGAHATAEWNGPPCY
jgi:hypothetical protein